MLLGILDAAVSHHVGLLVGEFMPVVCIGEKQVAYIDAGSASILELFEVKFG